MNPIVNDISFFMVEGKSPTKALIYDRQKSSSNKMTPVTEEQLNLKLHPSSNWKLYMDFDERALDVQGHTIKLMRIEYFEAHATLRDMLERIVATKCYGFMEGLRKMNESNAYCLYWGT